MNELIHIGNSDISVKEINGKRVVTFKDIDIVHGRPDGTARKRFADNRKHFKEKEDFFVLTPKDFENIEMSEFRTTGIYEVNPRGTAFITESGYMMLVKSFTDDLSWDVQRQLVKGYFTSSTLVNEQLSPQLQMFGQMFEAVAKMELADKERDRQIALANEIAKKAIETTENIKEAVNPIFDNWREETNRKFNHIQRECNVSFADLRIEMYKQLESRAGCDLSTRLRNQKNRMHENGYTKTAINNTTKMDVIEQDKKLREIFSKIVTEYEVKYCA